MSKIATTQDLSTYAKGATLDEALAQQVVSAVNAYVENYTHRVWGETKSFTEHLSYAYDFFLKKQDIAALTSIKLGYPGQTQRTLTENTDFWWQPWGEVTVLGYYASGMPYGMPKNYVEVTYTSGVEDVPDDLKFAALGIAYEMYQDALAGGKRVSEVQVGSYRINYSNRTPGPNGQDESTKSNFDVLDRYRQRRA